MKKYSYIFNILFICLSLFIVFYVFLFLRYSIYNLAATPVFSDDYVNYALSFSSSILSNRPVSNFIVYLLASTNPNVFICVIRVLFLVFFYQAYYVTCFFMSINPQITLKKFMILLISFIIVLNYPMSIYYAHYTGVITNLLSGNFALFSIVTAIYALNRKSIFLIICSNLLLLLSVLSKEDFILLNTLFVIFVFLNKSSYNMRLMRLLVSGLLMSFFAIGVFKYFFHAATMGHSTDPNDLYYFSINPYSIFKSLIRYFLNVNVWLNIYQISLILLMLLYSIICKRSYFFIVLLIILLILPYSVLPNHADQIFYQYNWVAFLTIGGMLILFNNIQILNNTIIIFLILCLLSIFCYFYPFTDAIRLSEWYKYVINKNFTVLSYLSNNRARINHNNVCVYNVDYNSPWNVQGYTYLTNVMGLNARWFVFTESNIPLAGFYSLASNSDGNVIINPNTHPNCVVFDYKNILER